MKISKSKRFFSFLIATTFTLFGLLVLCPVSVLASISDLTGTTWEVNAVNWVSPSLSSDFYFNGLVNSSIQCDGLSIYNDGKPLFVQIGFFVNDDYVYQFVSEGYLDSDKLPFTISFLGGSDVTNSDLISWVQNNGTLLSNFTPTPTPTPTPAPTPTPDPAEWLNNYIFNQTSEDMWVGVEDINADDVTYDVIPAWSYKNFYFRRNTTYRIIARTEQENVYYSLQYYTDLYNYVPLEYSLSSEGWYTYTELPYTSINISTGSDTNTSGIYTFVRFRHDLPTLPPVTPVPGSSFTPDPSSSPTEVPYITPIPGNPTLIPDNSTPTPIPDISGEAVAGFNKLTNIFNCIFDAAYQSVNAANGNFWSSFFFIGLPIFLVILGLIAWIIFGSSDDD